MSALDTSSSNESMIGQDFAASIVVADLAIRSSTFIPTSQPSTQDRKSKRRVTFNLDDIQIQTIPAYSSSSSSSSDLSFQVERISKKESYDALQQRKQSRRHKQPAMKPEYWYPFAKHSLARQPSLPTLRSLEMTEQLIAESIQREMSLYPHLLQYIPGRNTPSSSSTNKSLLIIDTDDEEEEEEEEQEEEEEEEEVAGQQDSLSLETTLSDDDPICIPYDKPIEKQTRNFLFVKVIQVDNLDLPIENDNIDIYCTIRYKDKEAKSPHQPLRHTLHFQHEMRIDDVDINERVAITLHITRKNTTWYHKIKPTLDLYRYVHEKDGSVCQTVFQAGQFIDSSSTAALMLVNNWYSTEPTSLLKRTSSIIKKRPQSTAKEKAVGKIVIQCVGVKVKEEMNYVPHDMQEAMEATHARRFYQTEWQSGYLTQLGGNAETPKYCYFVLKGADLIAYDQNEPLYKIPLSRATRLICENRIMSERPAHQYPLLKPDTLIHELESIQQDNGRPISLTNRFQLLFGEQQIQFSCESVDELNKWVTLLTVMITTLPKLPDWIHM